MKQSVSETGRDRRVSCDMRDGFSGVETGFIDAPMWIPCGGHRRFEKEDQDYVLLLEVVRYRGGW